MTLRLLPPSVLLILLPGAPAEQPTPPSPNLLRNTSFTQCATPGLPDYWGSLRIAERWKDAWRQEYYTTDRDSPVPGARSLRITVPEGKGGMEVISFSHWLPWRRQYTFSCYMRADKDEHKASMYVGSQFPTKPENRIATKLAVGTKWKRYSLTGVVKQGHWFGGIWNFMTASFSSKQSGTLWVAAPQLEFSSEASPYRPAEADAGEMALPEVQAEPTTLPPQIDGSLDDACWKGTPQVSSLVLVGEGTAVSPQNGTRVWVRYDQHNVYVAFHCRDQDQGKTVESPTPNQSEPRVHGRDSVEVFLKPDVSGTEYFDFALGRRGLRCDVKEFWYGWNNSDWRSGTAETEDGWTAEFAVPFRVIASWWEPKPLGPELGINFFRTRRPEGAGPGGWKTGYDTEMSVWFDSPDRAVRRPGAFGRVTGIDHAKVAFSHLSDLRLVASGLDAFDVVAELAHLPQSGVDGSLRVEVVSPNMDRTLTGEVPLAFDGEAKTVRIDVPGLTRRPGNHLLNAFVLDAKGNTIGRARRKFFVPGNQVLPGSDLEAMIERSYYTSETSARLLVNSNLDKPVRIAVREIRGRGHGNLNFGGERTIDPHGKLLLASSIEALQPGKYWLAVEACDEAGKRVAYATERVVKHPPAGREVKIDNFRRMILVNGKPMIAYTGNTQGPCVLGNTKTETKEGQKIVTWANAKNPDHAAEVFEKLLEDDRVIAYKFRDECWNHSLLRKLYERLRPMSPYVLLYNNFAGWPPESTYEGPGGTIDCTDVVSQCQYPLGVIMGYGNVGERRPFSFGSLLDFLKRSRQVATVNRKPMGLWLPTYGCDDAYRCPTPEEARCMTYLGLIYGVRIFKYFMGRPISNSLWESLVPLGKEMEALAEILGDFDAEELDLSSQGDIHYALWKSKGAHYLIAVNSWKEEQKFGLTLPPDCKSLGALFGERKRARLRQGRLTDMLGPFDRAVYRIGNEE